MPRYSLQHLIAIVAIAALVGGTFAYLNRSPLINLFGNMQNLRLVSSPSRVEVYRLVDPTDRRITGKHESPIPPTEYQTADGPVILGAELTAEVSEALTTKETYDWYTAKDCWPVYGLKFSFLHGADHVDVYFCFACDILTVVHDGKVVESENFDHARAVFVRAAKRSFPNDEVIERLSE